jgi:hypothetical protein
MLMRMVALVAGLALVASAGCGDDGGGGGSGKPALAGPLTYERGGGIMGRRDRLVVQPDRSAKLTTFGKTRAFELTAKEFDTLAVAVRKADLPSVPASSTSPRPVPDTFGHRIQYGSSTVTTDDPSIPDGLRPLVGELGRLVGRHGQSR